MHHHRPHHPTIAGSTRIGMIIFATLFVASLCLFFFYTLPSMRGQADAPDSPAATEPTTVSTAPAVTPPVEEPASSPEVTDAPDPEPVVTPPKPDPLEPNVFVQRLAEAINNSDAEAIHQLLEQTKLEQEPLALLNEALTSGVWGLVPESSVVELGRTPRIIRWAVLLRQKEDETTTDRVELDFAADESSPTGWSLARIRMASLERDSSAIAMNERLDFTRGLGALDHARGFVDALLAQDIEKARTLVDSSRVSDAKLAGLCLIFEEGEFSLMAEKPVVATVAKNDVAWFLVRVFSPSTDVDSQFGLVLKRPGKQWTVSEINLDRLLSFYAEQFGDGDRHFTPIIKNPKGGDLVVLYFGFDDSKVDPRTMRQLSIVAKALKGDPNRSVTITGHTDALGTDNYNSGLSSKRAATVRNAFIELGLTKEQVKIEAAGASQPRRANFRADGTDNPDGRKENRRAEIYLDF